MIRYTQGNLLETDAEALVSLDHNSDHLLRRPPALATKVPD